MDNKNHSVEDKGQVNNIKVLSLRNLAIKASNFSNFYAFGIIHHNASAMHQDTYALNGAKLRFLYQHIPLRREAEYLIVSSHNRTECFLFGALSDVDVIRTYLLDVSGDLWPTSSFFLEDEAAISHLTELSVGLNVGTINNAQMLSQIKESYKIADEEGTIGVILHRLLHALFRTAKRISTEADIAQGRLSETGAVNHEVNDVLLESVESKARAICEEMLTDFISWCFHYQAMQPAIDAIISTFEKIRYDEIERNKKRFSGLNYQQLDRITKSIMKRVLAIPAVRLKDVGPHNINYADCIKLLQLLFASDECEAENAPSYNQSVLLIDLISKQEEEHTTSHNQMYLPGVTDCSNQKPADIGSISTGQERISTKAKTKSARCHQCQFITEARCGSREPGVD